MTPVDKIRKLEAVQNDGRGVSCVRSVIHYMDRNDIEGARLVADWDHDKIRNYPEIEAAVRDALWPDGDAPSWWKRRRQRT